MTRFLFPALIVTLIVAIAGPAAVDFTASAIMALADATASDIVQAGK